MASSSFHSFATFRQLSVPYGQRPLVPYIRPIPILSRRSSPRRPVLAFSRRRTNRPVTSSKKSKSKQQLPHKDVTEEEDLDEDAFEALFSQLEEDLKNDDPSLGDGDGEISEEDLAKLEQELEEALGDDELVGAFISPEDDEFNDQDEEGDDEEKLPKLKTWQLRRLAYALKNGRRKTSIKNLAADVCLDRAVVLQLLRDPPPNLLLMSAALPDKLSSVITEAESKSLEAVPSETLVDEAQPEAVVKGPVHVMQSSWSARKRLKKVQVETLERVYCRTKRPTNAMISSIVHVTNLPRARVLKWFEDKRAKDGVPSRRIPYQRLPKVVASA